MKHVPSTTATYAINPKVISAALQSYIAYHGAPLHIVLT